MISIMFREVRKHKSAQPVQISLSTSSSKSSQTLNNEFPGVIGAFAKVLIEYREQTGKSFTNWSGVESQLKAQNELVDTLAKYGYASKAVTAVEAIKNILIKPMVNDGMVKPGILGPSLAISLWIGAFSQSAGRGQQMLQGEQNAKSCNNCTESYYIQGKNILHK